MSLTLSVARFAVNSSPARSPSATKFVCNRLLLLVWLDTLTCIPLVPEPILLKVVVV